MVIGTMAVFDPERVAGILFEILRLIDPERVAGIMVLSRVSLPAIRPMTGDRCAPSTFRKGPFEQEHERIQGLAIKVAWAMDNRP